MSGLREVVDKHTPSGAEGMVTCWCDQWFDTFSEHAEHVAAEWRAACTIRTPAELNALPTLSVILDADGVVVRRDPWGEFHDAPRWHPLDGLDHSAHDFGLNADEVQLPARLIWNPEWEAK